MPVNEMDINNQKMENADPPLTKPDAAKPITLEILKVIKDCHQQHGLRHGDYQRYRGYCSRRIARLRKVLKLPQGDRRHFKRRDVNDVHINNPKADDRWLQLPLVLAERNWAYAMQLRQESNTEPRKKFHLVQKLRKACGYALLLEELCKLDRCDARSKLESQAYVAWMHGTLHFELQLWASANEHLTKAKLIYERLATTLPDEDAQAPYKQRVEEIVPSLRYCAYNIGETKAEPVDLLQLRSQGLVENFEMLISQTKQKTATVLHEVKWFDLNVSIRLERVRLFLMSIENLDDSINRAEGIQDKIKILEDMFIDLRDIIALVREEVRADIKEQLVLHYLLSIRIERTVHRNLLLIQQTRRPQDCCRLLDIILQQCTELQQLEEMRTVTAAQAQYTAELHAFRTLRGFYMARTHAVFRRWRETAIVYSSCVQRLKDKQLQKISTEGKYYAVLQELLSFVKKHAEADGFVAEAQLTLEKLDEKETPLVPQKTYKSKKPLCERLDEFREDPQLLTKNPNVATLPPPMVPVPAKPLFYDLALNFIQMPAAVQERIEAAGGGQKQQKQAAGISGFVKGFLGWGGKK